MIVRKLWHRKTTFKQPLFYAKAEKVVEQIKNYFLFCFVMTSNTS